MISVSKRLIRVAAQGTLSAICLAGASAFASPVRITVENLNDEGGLWFTPVFFGFHDGSFDSFDSGSAASSSIEALAEEGDVTGLLSDISAVAGAKSHVLVRDDTAMGPPGVLFAPGTSNSFVIDLDAANNRYLSFASMILPSNDAFMGNDNSTAYSLFDMAGNFNDGFSIDIFGYGLWDAGTEENDTMGAPLSAIGGTSSATIGGAISAHPGLDNFIGTPLVVGTDLQTAFGSNTHIARISAQSVPDSASFIALIGAFALFAFKFANRSSLRR